MAAAAVAARRSLQLLLALLCCSSLLAAGSAAAMRPAPGSQLSPTVQLTHAHQSHHESHYRRSLQQDAFSNSDGCLATIPKCEPGACVARNVKGVARWVCLRCLSNYDPVVTVDGQDNIIQCVCPKGFYEAFANATSCTRCPSSAYCPGGDMVENPTTRGSNVLCGGGLITRTTGATSQFQCVAPVGYSMASSTTAVPCGTSEYAPRFNRLTKCMRCPGGLEEPPLSGLVDGQRDTKRTVCKLPPGKYMSQGLVRTCSQGFYRADYVDFDAAVARVCLACNPGITTAGAGARSASECNRVIPGYGLSLVNNTGGIQQPIPALLQAGITGLSAANVCALGYYSSGGYCAQCPANTVTRSPGAQSVEECAVPPGYVITGGVMTKCQAGEFRESWVVYADPKGTNCTSCGVGITSEARDVDENPLAANTSLVRGTSSSCYIEAGQGMFVLGRNTYSGQDCPANTYGAAGRVYGWASAPCKPCARNMITDNATRANSSSACINPGGFGYSSEGVSKCAPGFYSAKGSLKPCKRCPEGRTTVTEQQFLSDCMVEPGSGVAINLNGATSEDIFAGDIGGLNEQQILSLSVLQCPTGFYGQGNSLGSTCVKCPGKSTTEGPGALDVSQCSVCVRGYGRDPGSTECTLCDYGTFQPGGFATCFTCDATTFSAPVDGRGPAWTTNATTFEKGSVGPEWCLPVQSQLSPEAGQAFFGPHLLGLNFLSVNTGVTSLEQCFQICPEYQCCFAQLNFATSQCSMASLPPADLNDAAPRLYYKLPAAGLAAATSLRNSSSSQGAAAPGSAVKASGGRPVPRMSAQGGALKPAGSGRVKAHTLSSGSYATCGIPQDVYAEWLTVGSSLGADARTFSKLDTAWFNATSPYACSEMCDNSNVCWGFIFDAAGGGCLFRGGEDALETRSFFQLPKSGSATGVTTSSPAYYFALSGPISGAFDLTPNVQTYFADALRALLLAQQLPTELGADLLSWPEDASNTVPGVVVIGVQFTGNISIVNPSLPALDALLGGDNTTTTAALARGLFERTVAEGDISDISFYSQAWGLAHAAVTFTQDGKMASLGISIPINGCQLVPSYCGSNGAGSCTLSVCACSSGFGGYRCTTPTG